MITLHRIIETRKSLTNAQEMNLIKLLAYRCSIVTKRKIKDIVKYSFYSSFENKKFCHKIYVYDNDNVIYVASQDYRAEILKIRTELLRG